MNENTKNLKTIHDYCKEHKKVWRTSFVDDHFNACYEYGCDCCLKNHCIESKQRSRYNDPRFVSKMVARVEREKARKEKEKDPFKDIE